MGKKIEIAPGSVFNRWTVIRELSPGTHGMRFECKCECGTIQSVDSRNLRTGKSQGCKICGAKLNRKGVGAQHLEVNSIFGSWTVQSFAGQDAQGQLLYTCVCLCGHVQDVNASKLRTGRSYRCRNCASKAQIHSESTEDIGGVYMTWIIRGAKKRGFNVEITMTDLQNIWSQQKGKCALTGVSLTVKKKASDEGTASVDRIDSNGHYTLDNVQWVDKKVNRSKLDLPESEFFEMCKNVYLYKEETKRLRGSRPWLKSEK